MNEDVDIDEEITPLMIMEELMDSLGCAFDYKDVSNMPDEEWIKYLTYGIPEEFLKKGGDIYVTDGDSILVKLCKNVYFYSEETCGCLKVMGYRGKPDNV